MAKFNPTQGSGIVSVQPGPYWVLKDGLWVYDQEKHERDPDPKKTAEEWLFSYQQSGGAAAQGTSEPPDSNVVHSGFGGPNAF